MRGRCYRYDDLIARADRLIAEARRLQREHGRVRDEAQASIRRMVEIGRVLDPLLPHDPGELRRLREIVSSMEDQESGESSCAAIASR